MTWNVNDLPPEQQRSPLSAPSPREDADAALPTRALFDAMLLEPDMDVPLAPAIRREMAEAGMVDDVTWERWARLVRRGIVEL